KPAAPVKGKAKEKEMSPAKAAPPPTASDASSDSSSSSGSDSSESSDEEDGDGDAKMAAAPAATAKKTAAAKKDDEDDSESESDSSSSSEEDSDTEMEDVKPTSESSLLHLIKCSHSPATPSKKRKAEEEPAVPTKKAKLDSDAAPSGEAATGIFVGKLSWNVDDDWLKSEFESCGEVVRASVQMDRQSGKSRGFGYVTFSTSAAAAKAVKEMNGKEIDGRAVNVDLATPKAPNPAGRAKVFGDTVSPESKVLFVGNVSFSATEDMLWEAFGEHGDVVSVRLPTDRDSGQMKGYGYVEFTDVAGAKKAYENLTGYEIGGRNIRLDYSQPRDNDGGGGGGRGGFGGRGGGGR
ncbi:hypothetical protein M408DRAFT_55298, partial [Serendipita vermifera MAFF 305830]